MKMPDGEEKVPPPGSLPTGSIPLPEEAVRALNEGQKKIAEVNLQVNNYVAGLRHGLKVPDDWELDLQAKAFVPPKGAEGQAG